MIPSIFEAKTQGRDEWSRDEKAAWSCSMSGALIGFAGAVGALVGVFINVVLRAHTSPRRSPRPTLSGSFSALM
jgi:MFS transporter, NNP family, nitrate/nitrite transporter